MDKYVTSRELAERLKSAGYPQKTIYYWHENDSVDYETKSFKRNGTFTLVQRKRADYNFAAPLSDELLEQLPESIINDEYGFSHRLEIKRLGRGVVASYNNDVWVRDHKSVFTRKGFTYEEIEKLTYAGEPIYSDKPADALAELWLWCKAEGYIK